MEVAKAAVAPAQKYGARNMTRRSYWLAQIALGCGSILEWVRRAKRTRE